MQKIKIKMVRLSKRNLYKKTMILMAVCGLAYLIIPNLTAQAKARNNFLPINHDKTKLTIADKIRIEARKSRVDEDTAAKIAHCESRFNPRVRSKTTTATGVFQFTARTWFDYCDGDPKNADDNIKCFLKLYPKHPDWWECSKLI